MATCVLKKNDQVSKTVLTKMPKVSIGDACLPIQKKDISLQISRAESAISPNFVVCSFRVSKDCILILERDRDLPCGLGSFWPGHQCPSYSKKLSGFYGKKDISPNITNFCLDNLLNWI